MNQKVEIKIKERMSGLSVKEERVQEVITHTQPETGRNGHENIRFVCHEGSSPRLLMIKYFRTVTQ